MDFSRWKAGSSAITLIYQKWEDQHHLHGTWGHLWNTLSTVKRRPSSSTAAGRPLTQQQIELPEIRLLSYHTYPELYTLVLANAKKRIMVWKSRCCSKWTCSAPMRGLVAANIVSLGGILMSWLVGRVLVTAGFRWTQLPQSGSLWAAWTFPGCLSHCCAGL